MSVQNVIRPQPAYPPQSTGVNAKPSNSGRLGLLPAGVDISQIPTTTSGYAAYALKTSWDTTSGKIVILLHALGLTAVGAMLTSRAVKLRKISPFPWKRFFRNTAEITIPAGLELACKGAGVWYGIKAGKEITSQLKARNITNPTIDDIRGIPYFQQHKYMRKCLDNNLKLNNFLARHGLPVGPSYLPPAQTPKQ